MSRQAVQIYTHNAQQDEMTITIVQIMNKTKIFGFKYNGTATRVEGLA
ncbi:hypothetical protein SPAN111604_04480 [Sphingomonas antarctica]